MLQKLDVWPGQAHQALVLLVQRLHGVLALVGPGTQVRAAQFCPRNAMMACGAGRKEDEERNRGCQRSTPLMDQWSQRMWPSYAAQTG